MRFTSRNLVLLCFLSGLLGSFSLPAGAGGETSKPVVIYSKGVRLAGNLWSPPNADTAKARPGLLLVHGWGGTKDQLNANYASDFAARGYYVLTFDYRGWGESEGDLQPVKELPKDRGETFIAEVREVRDVVNPNNQFDDILAALSYLKGEPGVDATRIGLWGTSLGAGLALRAAIASPEVKVLLTQIGSFNPYAGYAALPGTSPAHPNNIGAWRSAIARGAAPSIPGEDSAVKGLKGVGHHPEILRHFPMENVEKLRAPTLIIDAENEEYFDIKQNGNAFYEKIKEQTEARYETLPGSHYDLYRGEGRAKALSMQLNWLSKHLPLE